MVDQSLQPAHPATCVSLKPLDGPAGILDVVGAGSDQNVDALRTQPTKLDKEHEDAGTASILVTTEQQADAAAEQPSRQLCQQWIDAAKDGDVRELSKLFQQHPALLNYQAGGLQCTALHWAAARGHAGALQRLVSWGADPCILTCTGCTALHSAAAANRVECVQALLTVPAMLQQVEQENEDGLTAAALALKHGHKVVQGMLLQAAARGTLAVSPAVVEQQLQQQPEQHVMLGMRPGFLLSGAPARRQVASHQAAELQSAAAAAASCPPQSAAAATAQKDGVEPSEPSAAAGGGEGQAVVIEAAAHAVGHQAPGEARGDAADGPQLESSSSAAAVDRLTGRAWLDAARAADLPKLRAMLAQHPQLLEYCGLGTSYALIGNSALHWAAAKNHVSCVQWLLSQGAQVNESLLNQAGATALHTAAEHGQAAAAQVLVLQGGGDVHLLDGLGQSAVAAAAGAGHEGLAHQLLLWDVVVQLAKADRYSWPVHQMQRLLQSAGKSAEAAACVERQELQQLVQQVLDSFGAVGCLTARE